MKEGDNQSKAESRGRESQETARSTNKEESELGPITISSVDEGIKMAGSCGLFQKFVTIILILGYMTGELFVQNMAYLELMPAYQCKDKSTGLWSTCYPDEFCRADQTFSKVDVRVDSGDSHTFNNWVDQLDLTCVDHSSIGLLGTMLFLGWMTSSMIVPRLSDIYGRKRFFLGFQVLQVCAIIALYMSSSVAQALAFLFVLGFSGVGRSPIVYIYLMEMLTPDYQKIVGPIFASSVALCLAFGTFVLQVLTKDATMI